MRFTSRNLIVPVLLLAMSGCMCRPAGVERPRRAAASQEEFLSILGERTRYWSSYQAEVHIRGQSTKGKFRLRAIIVAQLPDRLRIEAFTPFGQTAGVLVFNATGASLWVPSEHVLFSADRAETLVNHFLGISVPAETLGYALAASIPRGARLNEPTHSAIDSGWTISTADGPDVSGTTWSLLSQPLAMKTVSVKEGGVDYTISYEPAAMLEPRRTPGEILFSSSQWRLEIRIDQMAPDPKIRDGAFDLPVPPGIRRVRLAEAR